MSFSFCPIKTLPEWKSLVSKVSEDTAYGIWYITGGEANKINEYLASQSIKDSTVKYSLKSVSILSTDKAANIFEKGKKANWDLTKILTELQIPKEQKELILGLGLTNREDIILELASNYSYTININTAKDESVLTDMRFEGELPKTNYYANLTVHGGTNYTENEIATPAINPSIKGHAQFSTNNGIGWFRSDEEYITSKDYPNSFNDENGKWFKEDNIWKYLDSDGSIHERGDLDDTDIYAIYDNQYGVKGYIQKGTNTKTRRILEVQSDLFQKGRDKESLVANAPENGWSVEYESAKNNIYNGTENQFLQLLNKDNNWVTFFIKSIIQDSAKKGYEKVLFPSGDTASKVEGHTTLEEFKKQKEDRIKELERRRDNKNDELNTAKLLDSDRRILEREVTNLDSEIITLNKELERVETEGFGALKPIYNFYENTVKNILKKNYEVNKITDEYGNTWNEVSVPENIEIDFALSREQTGFETTVYEADAISVDENKVFYTTDIKRAKNPNLPIIVDRILLTDADTAVNKQKDLFLIDKNSSFYQTLIDVDYTAPEAEKTEQDLAEENPLSNDVLEKAQDAFTPSGIKIVVEQFDKYIAELQKLKKIVESKPKTDQTIKIIFGYESKINDLRDAKRKFIKESSLDNLLSFAEILESYMSNLLDRGNERDTEAIQQISNFLEALYRIDGKNIVFQPDYFELPSNKKKINDRNIKLSALLKKKNEFLNNVLLKFVKENSLGLDNATIEDILEFSKDIGFLKTNLLDLSKVNQPLIQALMSSMKKASSAAKQESAEVFEKLDELERKARNRAKQLGLNLDELMRQKDGKYYTGKVVSLFSASYWSKVVKMTPAQHIQFMFDNEYTFNPNILFNQLEREVSDSDFESIGDEDYANDIAYKNNPTYIQDKRAELIKNLKETLGTEYDKFYKEAEEKVLAYLQNKSIVFAVIEQDKELDAIKKEEKKAKWITENSPFHLSKIVDIKAKVNDKYGGINFYNALRKYTVHVPKKTIKGVDTGAYDKDYETLRKNKELRDYHDFYLKTLKDSTFVLPPSKRRMMLGNALPFLKATLIEKLSEGNKYSGKKAYNDFYDTLLSSIGSEVASTNLSEEVDPVTGTVKENFQLATVGSIDFLAGEELAKYKAIYLAENKKELPSDKEEEIRKQIVDKIARENSSDTVKLLRVYTAMSLAYKHKEGMETLVNIIKDKVYQSQEDYVNRQGAVKTDFEGSKGKKQGLNNLKTLLDYTISTVYYGKSPTAEEGVRETVRYTPEEQEEVNTINASIKSAKEELNKLNEVDLTSLNEVETQAHEAKVKSYEDAIRVLENSKKKLGKVIVLSKIADNYFLKWFRSISLGYNLSGAVYNGTVGYIFNWVEAASGKYFDDNHLEKAYSYMRKSYMTKEDREKRASLMRVYDVLKKSSDELTKSTNEGKLSRRFKGTRNILGLYAFMNNTEYLNQAPVLFAMLIKEQITDKNGKTSSLLEAYDSNGKLKEEFRTEENIANWETPSPTNKYAALKLKLDYAISAIHGNYDLDSPILANKRLFSRSAIMFRKWMFEGISNRIRGEEYDTVLGQNVKGRYRSGFMMFAYNSSFKQDNVSFYDKMSVMTSNFLKLFLRQTLRTIPGVTLSDNLNKKLQPDLDLHLNSVDAQNVRANMVEAVFMLQILGISTVLYALTKGEDDEEESYKLNIAINMLNRLSSDMSFYYNPYEGVRLISAIVPALGLLDKMNLFAESFFREEMELQSGQYEGMDARLVRGGQLVPVVSKYFSGLTLIDEVNKKSVLQQAIDQLEEE